MNGLHRPCRIPLLLASLLCIAAPKLTGKPNIVLIVADDLGWTDLSCYGSRYYETPNIDSLAAGGMRFTNAYASPNCAPTRAALMSGRQSPRTGIYTVGSGSRGLDRFRKMVAVENRTELAPTEVTLGEALRAAGYRTAHMGKWHLGSGRSLPTHQGFDLNIAGNARGAPGAGGYFSPYGNPNIVDGPPGEYLTDRLSEEAVRFIADVEEKPFFLYLAYYAVHTPITPRPDMLDKWKTKQPVGGHANPAYAAMLDSLDQGVGRILKTLADLDLEDDTVVIFYSDNGGVGGYRRTGVVAREVTDNAPLRGGKGMLYEGGIRVPLIVRYPGVTEPGSESESPVIHVDFYPTLLEIVRGQRHPSQTLDGVSFLAELGSRGQRPPRRRALYWHFPGYLQGEASIGSWRTTPGGAIRDGDYKLIQFFETGGLELYNLREDLSERRNLAGSEPDRALKLLRKLRAWREETGAPMPGEKAKGAGAPR